MEVINNIAVLKKTAYRRAKSYSAYMEYSTLKAGESMQKYTNATDGDYCDIFSRNFHVYQFIMVYFLKSVKAVYL